MNEVRDVTEADFEAQVSEEDGLVLVDLWAPWCAPCRALTPVIEDVADDLAGKVVIRKIDIEAEQKLRERLNVTTVPTLILFRDGKELDRASGAQSRARLIAWLEAHL